ncbi:radical SAM protein [bacterium]|nr:radical SAM protein [bacterium]
MNTENKVQNILLINPPLTQLNTPYPATAYLKGFLNQFNFNVKQVDLGLELFLAVFSKRSFERLFKIIKTDYKISSESHQRMIHLEDDYKNTIDSVVSFLQNKDSTLAYRICNEDFLPQGTRFQSLDDMDWAFGSVGIHDRARMLATLYLEDLSDLIRETVDPKLGFSRYAEKLALSAGSFQPIQDALNEENSLIDMILSEILNQHLLYFKPDLIGISIPFPGCLYGALKCGQTIRKTLPKSRIVFGGGFINTELRDLKETRIFEFVDFITMDKGESPLLKIIGFINNEIDQKDLHRTYCLSDGKVIFIDNNDCFQDIPFLMTGTPDYSDLLLDKYISVLEVVNPMHRLWNDGRWNKMTIAQGCYWGKCAFCDTSLDYIKNFETIPSVLLVDRMEEIIDQTRQTGFHFVDEAAPPEKLKDISLEILKRGLSITWWSNIRFENKYSRDLCRLMAAAGCIAVSGGLETASDRLLKKMRKGVTIQQAANILNHFQEAGILTHTYLMYGFPSQTVQETVDSLEIVRQFFQNGLIQSAFWHQFVLTAHSPISMAPQEYNIRITGPEKDLFAWNDLHHEDLSGCNPDKFSVGLKKALYNYMHGIGLEYELDFWFGFKTPKSKVAVDYIKSSVKNESGHSNSGMKRVIWIGNPPVFQILQSNKKGNQVKRAKLIFNNRIESFKITIDLKLGEWLFSTLSDVSIQKNAHIIEQDLEIDFNKNNLGNYKEFLKSDIWRNLTKKGLLLI